MRIRYALQLILLLFTNACLYAEDYIWPTDASRYLTSSFAEYRPGHFHAGIDVKTWGQEGYKVLAVRDGFISRIRVSPFGYGKVIYHRLDTGEIAIYAHLQKFNEPIERIVKNEQKRNGEYRINKYFSEQDLPVKQGDVIAYTGATGTGNPHLHFEIRDAQNNPVNPMLFGYRNSDSVPPGISAISITPLDVNSRVNSDVRPLILKPLFIGRGHYRIRDFILVSGHIGFAIDCFDHADEALNSYAVYEIKFFVDDVLQFSSKYDKFSYDHTALIDLDRDYRLNMRGIGLFQKLYIEQGNVLTFYDPKEAGAGVIRGLLPNEGKSGYEEGVHHFRVEVSDFQKNMSSLEGQFWVGEKKKIYPRIQTDNDGDAHLVGIYDLNNGIVDKAKVLISSNEGRTWRMLNDTLPIKLPSNSSAKILKVYSADSIDQESHPFFAVYAKPAVRESTTIDFQLNQDFYDDYIRLELRVSALLREMPRLSVKQTGMQPSYVDLYQIDTHSYYGVYQLKPKHDGPVEIEVSAYNLSDQEVIHWDRFDITTITPESGGKVMSRDGLCRVQFGPNAVYQNLFVRLNESEGTKNSSYDIIGSEYQIEPNDIPLKNGATLHLTYPAGDPQPDKLGIYGIRGKNGRRFLGSRVDRENQMLTARISSFTRVTLIRDTVPPELQIVSPKNNMVLADRTPVIKVYVKDTLSGIASENSITIRLDGEKIIAEYDPEKHQLIYEIEEPLSRGQHTLSVVAVDNCQNEERRKHVFSVQ